MAILTPFSISQSQRETVKGVVSRIGYGRGVNEGFRKGKGI